MNIEITGVAYLFFLLIVLLLTIQLAILTKIIVQVRNWVQRNSLDLMEIYSVSGLVRRIFRKVENGRKRDEKMARLIKQSEKNEKERLSKLADVLDKFNEDMSGVAKQCRSLDTLIHTNNKEWLETRQFLVRIEKSIKKSGDTLEVLDTLIKKSNSGGARIIKR